MNKFDKLTIYDVDFELETEDGEKVQLTFKPLPFKHYPKAFGIFTKLSDMDDKADSKEIFKRFDEQTITDLGEILKVMVQHSYPEIDDTQAELIVMSNMFQLIEPLSKVIFKQSKTHPRQVAKSV